MSDIDAQPRQAVRPGVVSGVVAVVSASVVAVLLCWAVAWLAFAAGASAQFQPLQLSTFGAFVVVGTIAGVVGWSVIRKRSNDPRRVLNRLVPTVLLISLVPDILVGVTGALPGTTWIGISALMVMHVVVTVCVVAACRWTLPIRGGAQAPSLA